MTLSYAAEVPVPAVSNEGSGDPDRQAPRVLPVCVQLGARPQEHGVPRRGDQPSKYDLMKQLPALKEELPWLKEVNAQSLQQSIHNLSRAFTNFFEGRAEEPTFKEL